jgi:transcription antitermination factor NusG
VAPTRPEKKYYVYVLAYPDGYLSKNGTDIGGVIFYVGKGTVQKYKHLPERMDTHEIEARQGFKSAKDNVIRDIWAKGLQVQKTNQPVEKCLTQVFQTGCWSRALTEPIESIQRGLTIQVRQEEQRMTPDPSGNQEPEKARVHFPKGQGVRIVEGPFTEYIGTVSESDGEQQKVTVLISFFGRPTPVVLDFLQVEKIAPLLS